jgi:hypothetical protein
MGLNLQVPVGGDSVVIDHTLYRALYTMNLPMGAITVLTGSGYTFGEMFFVVTALLEKLPDGTFVYKEATSGEQATQGEESLPGRAGHGGGKAVVQESEPGHRGRRRREPEALPVGE